MARKLWIGVGVLTIALFATVTTVRSQEEGKRKGYGHAQAEDEGQMPGHDEMMKMMEEMGRPGPQHAYLKTKAGTWKAEVKSWMGPGEPEMSYGTAKRSMILGGRYLEEIFNGEFGGQAFEGRGYTGYDNMKKKYVSSWMDNMATGIMTMEGDYDQATKTSTATGEGCGMNGEKSKMRIVSRDVDDNTEIMEMYVTGPDGKEMKNMEIKYTRM